MCTMWKIMRKITAVRILMLLISPQTVTARPQLLSLIGHDYHWCLEHMESIRLLTAVILLMILAHYNKLLGLETYNLS